MTPAVEQFRDAIRAAGLNPPDTIEANGKLHRFASNGKRGDDAGFYVLHADGIPAGSFGDWRSGQSQIWRADIGRTLTPTEEAAHRTKVEAMRRQREAEDAKCKAEARERANLIWAEAVPCANHPYLTHKQIKAHGTRLHNSALVIPMRDGGELHSLQFIGPDGEKRFLTGGRVAGCYFSIGTTKDAAALCIAEGFATGATIHEATRYPVAVAFNAGNLAPVARALRAKFPDLALILCADDDYRTAGNPGITKATEAARAVGGLLAIPDFGADRLEGATDFNDLHQAQGLEAVGRAVASASAPARTEHQPSGENAPAGDPTVNLIRGSDLKPEAIRWLWTHWLARGKLHMIAGAPGTGKTTLALALAATVTTGGRWPDGTRAEAGNILIWSGEDDITDTLLPRLLAMGADRNRIYFVGDVLADGKTRPFDPARDMQALSQEAARIGDVRLLIVDPVVNAVLGDSHKNTEVRRSLQPLVDLAARLDAAALGVSHFSKGTAGRDPVERVTGSVAFGALPRVVFGTAKATDGESKTQRLFVRAKSNIGPDGGGFNYALEQVDVPGFPGLLASRVAWGQPLDGTALELLAVAETVEDSEERGALTEVTNWLRDLLAEESGTMDKREIIRLARDNGFSERTIYRARDKLGVHVRTTGFGKDKRSVWSILPMLPMLPTKNDGKNGNIEGVQAAEPEAF